MTKTQTQVLADTLDFTRNITRFYLSKLKGVDMHQRFEVNGIQLNSAYWVLCHLVWAENKLVLQSTGGPEIGHEWQQYFSFGSKPESNDNLPDLGEALKAFKTVHAQTMDHLYRLPDEKLEKPNLTGVSFGLEPTMRTAIMHAIRHEGTHSGHLGWLCKLHGVETI